MEEYIQIKNKEIVYSISGQGQAIVLLHGFLEDNRIWHDFSKSLSNNFQAFVFFILMQPPTMKKQRKTATGPSKSFRTEKRILFSKEPIKETFNENSPSKYFCRFVVHYHNYGKIKNH